MKKWKCTFWRSNPQFKNGGYEITKIIEARTENSARNKAEKIASTKCAYGGMSLIRVEQDA